VRRHGLVGVATALAHHQDHRQGGGAGVDVDDGSAGEVQGAHVGQPAAGEHPVGDRPVDQHQPHGDEHRVGRELEAVGGRPGDQRRRDDRERHLVRAEQHERNGQGRKELVGGGTDAHVFQEGVVEVADHAGVAGIAEGQAEHDHRPEDGQQAHGEEVLHQHRQHVLRPDHASIEEGQARRHEQHQGG
jgi:hypothetical protein